MQLRGCLQRPVGVPGSGIRGRLMRLVFDERGVRPWARAVLFVALSVLILLAVAKVIDLVISFVPGLHERLHAAKHAVKSGADIPPWFLMINELMLLGCALLATWIMTRLEDRPLARIGLPRQRWVRELAAGCGIGFAMLGVLVAGLLALGFGRLEPATAGFLAGLRSGLAWAAAALLIGAFEEIFFRGYLFTIVREEYGFWTGTALVTALFMLGHGHNAGENPIGLLTTGVVSVFFCLAIRRTGALWWVIGCHAGWDWAESYFFGSADSGTHASGRLFTLLPQGNISFSGGTDGPEGSLLCLVVLLIAILALPALARGRPAAEELPAAAHPAGEP